MKGNCEMRCKSKALAGDQGKGLGLMSNLDTAIVPQVATKVKNKKTRSWRCDGCGCQCYNVPAAALVKLLGRPTVRLCFECVGVQPWERQVMIVSGVSVDDRWGVGL